MPREQSQTTVDEENCIRVVLSEKRPIWENPTRGFAGKLPHLDVLVILQKLGVEIGFHT
jgi:hypothetical protein